MKHFFRASILIAAVCGYGCGASSPAGSNSSGTSTGSGPTGSSTTGSSGNPGGSSGNSVSSSGGSSAGSASGSSGSSGGSSGGTGSGSGGSSGLVGLPLSGQIALAGLASGLDPSGVSVSLLASDGGVLRQVVTDDGGNYALGPVPDGSYGLQFTGVLDAGALGPIPYTAWLPQVSWLNDYASVDEVLGVPFGEQLASPLVVGAGTQVAASDEPRCVSDVSAVLSRNSLLFLAWEDGGNVLELAADAGPAVALASGIAGDIVAHGGSTAAALSCPSGFAQCTLLAALLRNPSGTRQFTVLDGGGFAPIVSPDGSQVAFFTGCARIPPGYFLGCELNLLPVNANVAPHATGEVLGMGPGLVFSRDGRFLAYVDADGSFGGLPAGTLKIVELDGGPIYPQPLTLANDAFFNDELNIGSLPPKFSPDGRYLAYLAEQNFSVLHVIDTNAAWANQDAGSAPGWTANQFLFSPDSSRIAFEDFPYRTLYVVDSAGTTPTQLNTAMPVGVTPPPFAFSPDSGQLAFTPGDAGLQLATFEPDGGISVVALEPDVADSVLFSPNGQVVAADVQKLGPSYPDILELLPVKGGSEADVSDPLDPASPSEFIFSPDSSQIAYREGEGSNGAQPGPLFLAELDGGRTQIGQMVPHPNGFAFSNDGSALVFIETFDGGSNSLLEAVSTQGGAPVPLNSDVIPPLVMTKRSAAAVRCKSPTPYAYENGLYVTPMP